MQTPDSAPSTVPDPPAGNTWSGPFSWDSPEPSTFVLSDSEGRSCVIISVFASGGCRVKNFHPDGSPGEAFSLPAADPKATLRERMNEFCAELERKGRELRDLQRFNNKLTLDNLAAPLCAQAAARQADKASVYETEARALRRILAERATKQEGTDAVAP